MNQSCGEERQSCFQKRYMINWEYWLHHGLDSKQVPLGVPAASCTFDLLQVPFHQESNLTLCRRLHYIGNLIKSVRTNRQLRLLSVRMRGRVLPSFPVDNPSGLVIPVLFFLRCFLRLACGEGGGSSLGLVGPPSPVVALRESKVPLAGEKEDCRLVRFTGLIGHTGVPIYPSNSNLR